MRTQLMERWHRRRGEQGFTLIEVLLTVLVVTAVMIPVLAWTVIALDESGDTGTTDDTTAFAQVSRFLTRDVATAELVSARQPGAGAALPPATCGDASPVWLRTADADLDVFYVTVDGGDSSELIRRECRGGTLVNETTVAEGLQDVTPPTRGTTTTSVPVDPAPVGVQCESRPGISAETDPCGVVVLTLRGGKGTDVTLRAERRLSPDTSGDTRPLPLITCDPESCSGFRGEGNLFTISFDASLSTAPRGIEAYAWSFYDPEDSSVVLPTTGVPESTDPSTDPIQFPCSPEDTPDSWRSDAGRGNPGCVFEVQLTIREVGGGEYTATRKILIENAVPEVVVVPDPVEAFRVTPVQFSTAGTVDPDGGTLTYEWDFGDGSDDDTSTDPNPSHTYECPASATLPCTYVTVLRVSDGYNEVVREIPVAVRNAPPKVGITGPTAFSRLNETLTWRATDPDDPGNAAAGPWDPDGNATRDGRYDFAPNQVTWKLVRLAENGESVDVLINGATGMTVNYTFTSFGRFLLTASVTDVDGQKTETALEVRVNNPPIARAAIGKGVISATNPTGTAERVFSPGNSPADAAISLDSTRSFDPDGGVLIARKWRVWKQDSVAPPGGVFPTCNSNVTNVPCEITDNSTADAEGRQLFTPPTIDTWATGRYRLVLVVVDDNLAENDCSTVSPWTSCNQPVAGTWWVPLRINAKPTVGALTYASAPGSFRACATPPLTWILCRTTSYIFSTATAATDPDSSSALTYEWVVPFGVGTVPGGPTYGAAFPAGAAVPQTGTLQLRVTDSDGGVTVVSRTLQLRNHPPSTFILVGGDPTGRNAVGTWTTPTISSDPYVVDLSLTGGDPDNDIVYRRWTFERRTRTGAAVVPADTLTVEAVRTGGVWNCSTTGTSTSMSITPAPDLEGCAKIRLTASAYGRYVVNVTERDSAGDESSDSTTLLVLEPAIARIKVTSGIGNSCLVNNGALLPRTGDVVSLGNVTTLTPCFDARDSDEGNAGNILSYRFELPGGFVGPRNWYLHRIDACTTWAPGQPLENCFRFPVKLTVTNQAGFPTETTVWVRFNARPIARQGAASGSSIRWIWQANGNLRYRLPASCVSGCTMRLDGRDPTGAPTVSPTTRSFDPDGGTGNLTSSPIPDGNYTWDQRSLPGTVTSAPGSSLFELAIPAGSLFEGAGVVGPRLTVRDAETPPYSSVENNASGEVNRRPLAGFTAANPFRTGLRDPFIPLGETAGVELIVPEAGNPTNQNCSGLAESTAPPWAPIPTDPVGSQPYFSWTFTTPGGTVLQTLSGVSGVRCQYGATGSAEGRTIVTSPPVTFSSEQTVLVGVTVTDTDGDSVTIAPSPLQVRSRDPLAVIQPVGSTPPSRTCQLLAPSGTLVRPTSANCSVWTTAPAQSQAFELSAAGSSAPGGAPLTYQWRLLPGATGGAPLTTGCVANAAVFSCTVPNAHGVYRAELTVSYVDGGGVTRTGVAVYYLKQNQRPAVTLNPPGSLDVVRGQSVSVGCSASDADSRVESTSWEIRDINDQVVASQTNPTNCQFSLPLSVPPGPITFSYVATDLEGAQSQTPPIVLNVVNQSPAASITMAANGQLCATGSDPCVRNPSVGVDLDAVATDPDGAFASYVWTVRNPSNEVVTGLVPDGANPPVFSLSVPGVWSFELTATDNNGATATASRTLRVNGPPRGTSAAEGDVTVNGELVLDSFSTNEQAPFDIVVAADNWTDEDQPLSYEWTLTGPADGPSPGPSLIETGQSATFNIPIFGEYELTLEVTDSLGLSTVTTRDIEFNAQPVAEIAVLRGGSACPGANQASGCVVNPPVDVEVQGSGTDVDGTIAGYEWSVVAPGDTGSSVISTDQDVDLSSLVEGEVGEYAVSLVVIDNNGMRSEPVSVIVFHNPPPTVSFDPGTLEVPRGVPYDVAANGVDPAPRPTSLSYLWQVFQDGDLVLERETSTGVAQLELSPALVDLGEATLEVTVFDADGGVSGTASRTFTVVNALPEAFIDTDPTSRVSSAASQTWTFFSFAADPDGSIAKVWWQIRDSQDNLVAGEPTEPASGLTPSISYAFTVPDTYTATVFVRDDLGGLAQTSVQVVLNTPPTACIDTLTGPPVATSPVLFDGSCSDANDVGDSITEYAWSATGPGEATFDTTSPGASEAAPLVTFPVAGDYTVRLIVVDDREGVSNELSFPVTVVAP